jgi:protocatechuate 3,4-dioxygenase beta subunit
MPDQLLAHDHPDGIEEHDLGLSHDVSTLIGRRQVLGLLAGAGLATLVGCSSSSKSSSAATTSSTSAAATTATSSAAASTSAAAATCVTEIPEETAGPYPGDGSNGPNILTASGIVRSDVRSSFGSASGVAMGVPTTVHLTITDADKCTALPGAAVYLWHCNSAGAYSMYDDSVVNENYLRGVQVADDNGLVTFTTIFPAAYSGRWPHMHFEVYPSLSQATSAGTKLTTSQLALPEDVCTKVYATSGYDGSSQNLAQTSLTTDNVFGDDGGKSQLATVTGSVSSGYTVALAVGV